MGSRMREERGGGDLFFSKFVTYVMSLHLHNNPGNSVPLFLFTRRKLRLREVEKLPKDPQAVGTTMESGLVKTEAALPSTSLPNTYSVVLIRWMEGGWVGG